MQALNSLKHASRWYKPSVSSLVATQRNGKTSRKYATGTLARLWFLCVILGYEHMEQVLGYVENSF